MIAALDNRAMNELNFSVTLNAPGSGEGELAVIRASGADAGTFLQGQLTQDVLLMRSNEARLAAWCSAKGRMLASFAVCKSSNEEFLLILSRDLLTTTLKRMRMFVMRAKCVLTDVTGELSVQGLVGAPARAALVATNSIALSGYSMPASGTISTEIIVQLPNGYLDDAPIPRALRISPARPDWSTDASHVASWNAMECASGIARLTAAVSEAFVPQMLNYESVGGVNFKKGCYPGQEVVARSQFRGTLKRRAYIATSEMVLQAGQEVFDSHEPDQPCGLVAQAAEHPSGGFIAIMSMQISAQNSDGLHIGSPSGARLRLQRLPYELLADI